jgi:LmbE family N-acetylglucosaminyl deacetylase
LEAEVVGLIAKVGEARGQLNEVLRHEDGDVLLHEGGDARATELDHARAEFAARALVNAAEAELEAARAVFARVSNQFNNLRAAQQQDCEYVAPFTPGIDSRRLRKSV